ncbi:MAG: hypothetical protein ACKOBM_13685, partial [Gammaproteobacteria bacterium]
LQRAGLTDRQVMIVVSGLSLSFGLIGIIANRAGVPEGVLFLGFLSLCLLQTWTVRRIDRVVQTLTRMGNTGTSG